MTFAIKAEVDDPRAETLAFSAQKTMYGGKHIAKGDTIFVFASENEGGPGLIANGIITSAKAIARKRGVARQTPRVSITVKRTALAKRQLGRGELKRFSDWKDGRPETEINVTQRSAIVGSRVVSSAKQWAGVVLAGSVIAGGVWLARRANAPGAVAES